MQTQAIALALLLLGACQRPESAADAIQRNRGTLVDAVSVAGEGVPFYSEKVLNPTWNPSDAIVRVPESQWTDENGRIQTARLFQGKTTVVAFLFTSCSGFCPFVIEELKQVEKAASVPLQFAVFTVDPEFDTSARLKSYAQSHQVDKANWHFLRASKEQITDLIQNTFASQLIRRSGANGRDFVHAGHFYIFDDEGRLRGIVNGTELRVSTQVKELTQKLNKRNG